MKEDQCEEVTEALLTKLKQLPKRKVADAEAEPTKCRRVPKRES